MTNSETDFVIAASFLRAALTELKKGEHDQLCRIAGSPSIEEEINALIDTCYHIKKRWESDFYD